MSQAAALMFGTDVVSCIYADQWNQKIGDAEPIVGFIPWEDSGHLLTFRPGATLVETDEALSLLAQNRVLRVVCPEHRRAHLERWAKSSDALPPSTEVVSLPQAPDYVLEWIRFDGTIEQSFRVCEGYDAKGPTRHAVLTQLERKRQGPGKLIAHQLRQIQLIEMFHRQLGRPLRVIDFGGAAGGHFFSLTDVQQQLIEQWVVVETPEMATQARETLACDKLSFIDSISDVEGSVDLVLASSSLQYVDDFEGYLSALVGLGAQFFCIDRTPMGAGEEMEIFLQRVFRSDGEFQYETSYPMFVYPESEYMEILSREYTVNVKNVLHGDSVETDDGKVDLFFVVGSRRET